MLFLVRSGFIFIKHYNSQVPLEFIFSKTNIYAELFADLPLCLNYSQSLIKNNSHTRVIQIPLVGEGRVFMGDYFFTMSRETGPIIISTGFKNYPRGDALPVF